MVEVEVINVRDNGDYLTATVKFDFGGEGTVDIPVDTDISKLNNILLGVYKEHMEKQAKKQTLFSYLKGTIELIEEEVEEIVEETAEEIQEETNEAISGAESFIEKLKQGIETTTYQEISGKMNELLTVLKDKFENITPQDIDVLKSVITLISKRPDIKNMINETINKLTGKSGSETEEIGEDSREGIPEEVTNFPWDTKG